MLASVSTTLPAPSSSLAISGCSTTSRLTRARARDRGDDDGGASDSGDCACAVNAGVAAAAAAEVSGVDTVKARCSPDVAPYSRVAAVALAVSSSESSECSSERTTDMDDSGPDRSTSPSVATPFAARMAEKPLATASGRPDSDDSKRARAPTMESVADDSGDDRPATSDSTAPLASRRQCASPTDDRAPNKVHSSTTKVGLDEPSRATRPKACSWVNTAVTALAPAGARTTLARARATQTRCSSVVCAVASTAPSSVRTRRSVATWPTNRSSYEKAVASCSAPKRPASTLGGIGADPSPSNQCSAMVKTAPMSPGTSPLAWPAMRSSTTRAPRSDSP
mmetsp:Transcript_2657/g.8539  ORF Transcript_2657/g.8539 Transcript_2657/m.8539 type:complete len:338 (+) Transcript_2657:166-1179(+)